nr:TIGR01244 family sulfur transferase [uncultured Celeribacter sp.]
MDFNKVNEQLTVSSQITPEEVSVLADKGYTTLVCNRPDMEIDDDQSSDAMAVAADAAGLSFHYLPVIPGQFTPELILEMAQVMEESAGPVYAYCRSGTRSTTLWALSQAGQKAPEEILKEAAGAGYDLSGIAGYLAG